MALFSPVKCWDLDLEVARSHEINREEAVFGTESSPVLYSLCYALHTDDAK